MPAATPEQERIPFEDAFRSMPSTMPFDPTELEATPATLLPADHGGRFQDPGFDARACRQQARFLLQALVMEWQDEGILLSARLHGEGALVVQAFTPAHGRHGGLVRGGASRTKKSTYQLGNRLALTWRARLPDQLGNFTAELITPNAALIMDEPPRLAALRSACALVERALPDRDPHPDLYNFLCQLIDTLTTSGPWAEDYVRFELALLADLGFGLDLSGADLVYVSPRTGRAVTGETAKGYEDRLLPLPGFLLGQHEADAAGILAGLRLAGWFLQRHLFAALDRPVPEQRQALIDRLTRDAHVSR